jgi:hypothetical protein
MRASRARSGSARELRMAFHHVELRLRIRVVMGGVGPAMALEDAHVYKQICHQFRTHGGATISMQCQCSWGYPFASAGGTDDAFGEGSGLAVGDLPADYVAVEDIEMNYE